MKEVCSILVTRATKFVPWDVLKKFGAIRVAGSCLNGEKPNDIDLFPVNKGDFTKESVEDIVLTLNSPHKSTGAPSRYDMSIVTATANAWTVVDKNKTTAPLQFCSYHHETLEDLVDSFDYSHVQMGVEVFFPNMTNKEQGHMSRAYISDSYIQSRLTGVSQYVGSKYPTASLIRLNKYRQRGTVSRVAGIQSVLNCISDIVERGFKDYDDLKDQFAAVDLHMPENADYAGSEMNRAIMRLFKVVGEGRRRPDSC